MRISEVYGPNKFGISFELFPPRNDAAESALEREVEELVALRPSYITCTYGAGGSTRDKTLQIIANVHKKHGLPVATHLTCVGNTEQQLCDYLSEASERGVTNVVALRGDPPKGETSFKPVAGGLSYANELVALIRRKFPKLGIAVAGYPEKHLEAPSADIDLENLKRKVAAGADAVITQLFYDNADFFRFRERYDRAGIQAPLVPGLLPVTNLAQIKRITSLCGAQLPEAFINALARFEGDEQGQFNVGVEQARQQAQELIDSGIPGIHLYVLNKSPAATRVLSQLRHP